MANMRLWQFAATAGMVGLMEIGLGQGCSLRGWENSACATLDGEW